MQRSTQRILTTHCGSLPRPDDLLEMLMAREEGRLHDMQAFHARVRKAVGECVRQQRDTSLDIVNDGEWSKPDYSTYVKNRLTGFAGEPTPPDTGRDRLDFPEYAPFRRSGVQLAHRASTCDGQQGTGLTLCGCIRVATMPLHFLSVRYAFAIDPLCPLHICALQRWIGLMCLNVIFITRCVVYLVQYGLQVEYCPSLGE